MVHDASAARVPVLSALAVIITAIAVTLACALHGAPAPDGQEPEPAILLPYDLPNSLRFCVVEVSPWPTGRLNCVTVGEVRQWIGSLRRAD